MKVIFTGQQGMEQTAKSLMRVLRLFHHHYGIAAFRDLKLNLTLCDIDGHEVELVDASTSEILDTFEVQQTGELKECFTARHDRKSKSLKLIVDNTK